MAQLIDHLNCLEVLKNNWDGRGSAAPSAKAIRIARGTAAVPLGSGGIQIELHANGSDVEIELNEWGEIVGVGWTKTETPAE